MACTIIFRPFWGGEQVNPPQSRGYSRPCSIAGLGTSLVEIPSGSGSLRENKPLKDTKVFPYMCSLPPPRCCFSPQSSCKNCFPITIFPLPTTSDSGWSCQLFSPAWMTFQISHLTNSILQEHSNPAERRWMSWGILRGLKGYTFIFHPRPEQLGSLSGTLTSWATGLKARMNW